MRNGERERERESERGKCVGEGRSLEGGEAERERERTKKKGDLFLAVSSPFSLYFPSSLHKETHMSGCIGPRGIRVVELLDVGLGLWHAEMSFFDDDGDLTLFFLAECKSPFSSRRPGGERS